MRRKLFLILLPVLISSIFLVIVFSMNVNKIHQISESPEATLLKSFSQSGAQIVNNEIYFWGRVGEQYNNINRLEVLANEFAGALGVVNNTDYSKKNITTDSTKKLELNGITHNNRIVSINAQLNLSRGKVSERFISVNVTENISNSGLEEIRKSVISVFDKHKISPKVNSCITGSFKGKLNTGELNEISYRIFNGAEAKKVEGMRDANLISVSAYSPFIDNYITVNDKKVNLNLAVRYNSYEDKTYIWLATPLITTEY